MPLPRSECVDTRVTLQSNGNRRVGALPHITYTDPADLDDPDARMVYPVMLLPQHPWTLFRHTTHEERILHGYVPMYRDFTPPATFFSPRLTSLDPHFALAVERPFVVWFIPTLVTQEVALIRAENAVYQDSHIWPEGVMQELVFAQLQPVLDADDHIDSHLYRLYREAV